jgi:hypothetical protein
MPFYPVVSFYLGGIISIGPTQEKINRIAYKQKMAGHIYSESQ